MTEGGSAHRSEERERALLAGVAGHDRAAFESLYKLYHRPLEQLGLPRGIKIGAIVRHGQVIIPQPDTQLDVGDHIVALVAYSNLRLAEALLGPSGRPTK